MKNISIMKNQKFIYNKAYKEMLENQIKENKLDNYLSLKNSAKSLVTTQPYFMFRYKTSNPLFPSP